MRKKILFQNHLPNQNQEISNSSDTLVGQNEQDAKLNDTENKSTQQNKSDDQVK